MEGERLVIRISQPVDNSVDANEVGEGLLHLIRNGITPQEEEDEQRHDENARQKNIQKRSNIM